MDLSKQTFLYPVQLSLTIISHHFANVHGTSIANFLRSIRFWKQPSWFYLPFQYIQHLLIIVRFSKPVHSIYL